MLNVDMTLLNLVQARRITTPMLVLEGADIGWGKRAAREIARASRPPKPSSFPTWDTACS